MSDSVASGTPGKTFLNKRPKVNKYLLLYKVTKHKYKKILFLKIRINIDVFVLQIKPFNVPIMYVTDLVFI